MSTRSRGSTTRSAAARVGLPLLWLEGELSNLSAPASGHWYFSLKDSQAQVRCAMWRQRNTQVRFRPKDGMAVLVRARVRLYEPRGEYQLIVEHLEEAGEGALKREFEELKAKLAAEGLFAAERKRPLPRFRGDRRAYLSDRRGYHDILRVLARVFPRRGAALPHGRGGRGRGAGYRGAIEFASRRKECDVLIVARGGGSSRSRRSTTNRGARDLSLSHTHRVWRGSRIDFTIADFVADARAPTPSAAASATVPDKRGLLDGLGELEQRIANRDGTCVAGAGIGAGRAGAASADLASGPASCLPPCSASR